MKLSKVIYKLQDILEVEGDIDVRVLDNLDEYAKADYVVEDINVIHNSDDNFVLITAVG